MNEMQILKFEMKILRKQIRVLWKHIKKLEELKESRKNGETFNKEDLEAYKG